jgi:LPS-assembly lipoprotein
MSRALLLAALVAALAGCGFKLRGAADLPFETIYVPGNSGIALDLKRNIAAGTRTRVIEDRKSAQAVMEFTHEMRQKDILSLTAAGRVREFRLKYRVGFRVHDGKGGEFVPASALELSREVTFNDAEVLAKETEEQLLYRDMQFDMVQLIMRRLAAAPAQKPAAR